MDKTINRRNKEVKLNVQNDKLLKISTATNRKSTNWKTEQLYWSDFINRIKTPTRTSESFAGFMNLNKAQQDDLKDVGGFVGGELKNNRRKAENVINRCLVTLDADNIGAGRTAEILKLLNALSCAYAVYSTRKHSSAKPRLRIIIPTDKLMTPEQYEPIARKIASFIGMSLMDPSTFEASRLMYWPSCSSDSEYVFKYEDKPFASVDGMLKLYKNWKNINEWPRIAKEPEIVKQKIKSQQDPLKKENIVGAFCKVYDIYSAIATFLSDIYTPRKWS